MPENILFEYAVIRVVPRVEREEFMNVGVIVFCKRPAFLRMRYQVNESRLLALDPALDIAELRSYLQAFEAVALGQCSTSVISKLDAASRFRWLTATRSTILQTSRVHPGLCQLPEVTLNQLFEELVG
ncbi:DUF3037 domain-containing protein [Filimonas effusa]|uniref:DUF3037 domain-containing protein n=1 Tax=Filimonas effusa TaxID=2508721 RepID=A0A4Q1DE56_9BACT|nr:DUF3037 domain-containing protein [Filimonas effusa]RXK86973.1 DUF3037 domain-containing protein [Filimonas effusa]